jgi:hypothetical protein
MSKLRKLFQAVGIADVQLCAQRFFAFETFQKFDGGLQSHNEIP